MRSFVKLALAGACAAAAFGTAPAEADQCYVTVPGGIDQYFTICTRGEQDPYWHPLCLVVTGTGGYHYSVCGP